MIDPSNSSTIYVGGNNEGMSKSTDGGRSWTSINIGLPVQLSYIGALAIDPVSTSVLYAGATAVGGGVYKSSDGGQTWSAINSGLGVPDNNAMSVLVVDPTNSSNVFAGSAVGSMYKSANGGESWSSISSGLPGGSVTSIVLTPANPSTVYASFDGGGVFGSGVFKSVNGGQVWAASNNGLPGTGVTRLAIDKGNPSTIYAGTVGYGVFKSTDAGQTWQGTAANLAVPSVSLSSVANAASGGGGSIAPGEIVVLYGSGLGPAQLVQDLINNVGLVDTQLAGTTVLFNGTPAPLIYTSTAQVAAVVPYSVFGSAAQVTVTYQGQTSTSLFVGVASSAPGVFTLDSSGKGQAAAVNQDGSINTAGTPAKSGDIISIFVTGEGQTSPNGVDGKPATFPYPKPNLPVTVTIGGQTATPLYAGGAPGEVAGLMQVNVQIPNGIQTGSVPLVVQVGSVSSQPGVTVAVH